MRRNGAKVSSAGRSPGRPGSRRPAKRAAVRAPIERRPDRGHEPAKRGSREPAPKPLDSKAAGLVLQDAVGNRAIGRLLRAKVRLGRPGSRHEGEAARAAARLERAPTPRPGRNGSEPRPGPTSSPGPSSLDATVRSALGPGEALPERVRGEMEAHLGRDFRPVRLHRDARAGESARAIGARAFTIGRNVAFGPGEYSPDTSSGRRLLAHELAHVAQQESDPGLQGRPEIQRDLAMTLPVTHGGFGIDMRTREDLLLPGPPAGARSGMSGTIDFEPATTAPYSNEIKLIQIGRALDTGPGTPVRPGTVPPGRLPRISTTADPTTGVEGGFIVDVLHTDPATGTTVPPGGALPLDYPFGRAGSPGGRQIHGYKRSSDPRDIKKAELFDFPGLASVAHNVDIDFETVAKGEDTDTVFGALHWGFGIRAGRIINETAFAVDAPSATFESAVEIHRDFYVHEPVTFYFGFDRDTLDATEEAKILAFLPYLGRFPDVRMNLEGFADLRGSVAYNLDLADRRANAVAQALLRRGVDAHRITLLPPHGKTTQFTADAAPGRSQDLEANRRGNRRVTLTFEHTASFPGP